MDIKNALILGAFLINFILSLIIHFRSTRNRANITFEITAFGITAWCLAMMFFRASDESTAIYWTKLLYFFPTFIPTAFLLFGLYFPNYQIKKRSFYSIVLLNALMSILVLYDGFVVKDVIITPGQEKVIIFGPVYYALYPLYITGFFLASYYVLFRKYLKASPYIRMQILYILLGMTAASMPAMVTNLNLPTFGYFELNWVGQLFTVFWVGGVTYAIVRHRLLDIRFVVARVMAYTFLIIVLASSYVFGLFFLAGIFLGESASEQQLIVSAMLAIFVAFSFQPLRQILETLTDKFFFKGYYDSQKLLASLSSTMATTLDLDLLVKHTLDQILTKMKIANGTYIFILNKEGEEYLDQRGSITLQNLNRSTIDIFFNSDQKILVREELVEGKIKESLRSINASVVIRLETQNKKIGILALSDKSSGDIYSQQDIKVFEILGPELSVAIHNAQEYEEIKKFNITLKSEIEKATADLKSANEKLQELDKLKDEFVSLASHELRTPMTAIKSYVWLLLFGNIGELSEKQKTYLQRTYISTERLIKLVNDMLNISRIESGRFEVEIAETDMNKLIEEVIFEVQARANEVGVNLVYKSPEKQLLAAADSSRVKEIIINLIGNSIKFTPGGGSVFVNAIDKGDFVEISVSDTGRGIASEDMSKLFKKFNMLGGSFKKEKGQGTGLGLYLSKSLVELQKGKIWVTSDGLGKGAKHKT